MRFRSVPAVGISRWREGVGSLVPRIGFDATYAFSIRLSQVDTGVQAVLGGKWLIVWRNLLVGACDWGFELGINGRDWRVRGDLQVAIGSGTSSAGVAVALPKRQREPAIRECGSVAVQVRVKVSTKLPDACDRGH